ncbi:MAG: NAD(P)H-hydrate dehydratase [Rhodoferax sp.]|nr:NAD(P)H-hydrate dehydratase [Rhodoferax sp.]
MLPPPRRIDARTAEHLHDVAATRLLETLAWQRLPAPTLMQRAGRATARLALALAPHARTVWIAAGPGNNGGDGLEAAACLQAMGQQPVITWLGDPARASADTRAAWEHARQAGVLFSDAPPPQPDLCVDALLGIGARRAPEGRLAECIQAMQACGAPVLAVDLPSGLDADTGHCAGLHVRARHTLSLLTLKPGLFTAMGRDAAGQVWLDALGVGELLAGVDGLPGACARVGGEPAPRTRLHASHKGSHGDVVVIGGAPGMAGAALLAASAALHYGAGRVFLAALDPMAGPACLAALPAVMQRTPDALALDALTVVIGCGGGDGVRTVLPRALTGARQLVVDADALNALAADADLQRQLRQRADRGRPTVLTPHPLEAARLLGTDSRTVQQDRLAAARRLADQFQCTVVLKGSGTLIASPGGLPHINATGNGRLATAGTGDVLAGALGAALAAGLAPQEAAREAVWQHGLCADRWPDDAPLEASLLARRLQAPGQPAAAG